MPIRKIIVHKFVYFYNTESKIASTIITFESSFLFFNPVFFAQPIQITTLAILFTAISPRVASLQDSDVFVLFA